MKKRQILFLLLFLFPLCLSVRAANEARCVNNACDMRIYGERADTLLDGNLRSHSKLHKGTELTVNSSELIGGLYLEFSAAPGEYTLRAGDQTRKCGQSGFLHQYIGELNCYSLTLRFQGEGILANVYVLSPGDKPEWVQDWEPCWDRTDVLLLPTHSDDDALFFGGIIPWCLDRGARVQVAYLISHSTEPYRCNELLNALWVSGLRNYPVLGIYEDLGPDESMEKQIELYAKDKVSYDDMLLRQLRLYRQFRPQVVICHDSKGEYGHGAHKLYYQLAADAMEMAGNGSVDASSAARFGVWTPSKLYVHLLRERPVVIDLDEPLRSFNYRTGYELAQKAFACHESQYDFFSWYFWGAPTAAQLQQYSAREYGLYYSAVGDDVSGRSFFDNLTLCDSPGETDAAPAEAEAPETLPEEAPEAAPAAEEESSHSAATLVNPRLGEIRAEQRRLVCGICALLAVVAALLITLHKLKIKEREQ